MMNYEDILYCEVGGVVMIMINCLLVYNVFCVRMVDELLYVF